VDAEVQRLVDLLTSSGMVSAASNRRSFRASEEPLDAFRRYMAIYTREQAHCHFSPALIRNLEANWNAASAAGNCSRRGSDRAVRTAPRKINALSQKWSSIWDAYECSSLKCIDSKGS
jgi:hypothetical protein